MASLVVFTTFIERRQRMEGNLYHNWMYVIIPNGPENKPLLAAYCKNCNQGVTQLLKVNQVGMAVLTPLNIPKTGCAQPSP
jgi:hypothetical protein